MTSLALAILGMLAVLLAPLLSPPTGRTTDVELVVVVVGVALIVAAFAWAPA